MCTNPMGKFAVVSGRHPCVCSMSSSKLAVLVVHPQQISQADLCSMLGGFGIQTHGLNGEEPLGHGLNTAQTDVVLFGAGAANAALVQQVRQNHPHVGIVVLTVGNAFADASAPEHADFYLAGADVCLSQPWQPLELQAVLNKLGQRVRNDLMFRQCH